jgi:hypothetical protein
MAVTAPAPTLKPGQQVLVRHLHIGALPATVERCDGDSVVVALAVNDSRLSRVIGHDMAVEALSGRGIHRFGGTLSSSERGLLTVALSGEVERIQRREYVRVSAHVEVKVRGIDEPVGGETVTLDVSGSGILISDPWQLALGMDVHVELMIPGGGEPLRALGRVVRAAAEDQKGIRLDGLGRADEDRLMRFIRDRELQALRASRDR